MQTTVLKMRKRDFEKEERGAIYFHRARHSGVEYWEETGDLTGRVPW